MTALQALGAVVLAIPFAAIFGVETYLMGWKATLCCWAAAGVLLALICTGTWLLSGGA